MFKVLKDVGQKDAVAVDIMHPADETQATGITITIASPFSPEGKAAQFAVAEFLHAKGTGGVSLAEFEPQALASIVATTKAWSGVVDEDDHPVACTPETVRALYEAAPWIREQVQAAVTERARFFAPVPRR